MKRNRNGSRPRQETIQVWTHDQARRVLPYVASIMRTLRDYRLEALQHDREARKLAALPGRPDRAGILALQEAKRAAEQADSRFQEALEELHILDVYCLDPVQGLALIPFARDNQLAWFVFNLFESDPLQWWRYHRDPLEKRRPMQEALEGPPGSDSVIV